MCPSKEMYRRIEHSVLNLFSDLLRDVRNDLLPVKDYRIDLKWRLSAF